MYKQLIICHAQVRNISGQFLEIYFSIFKTEQLSPGIKINQTLVGFYNIPDILQFDLQGIQLFLERKILHFPWVIFLKISKLTLGANKDFIFIVQ